MSVLFFRLIGRDSVSYSTVLDCCWSLVRRVGLATLLPPLSPQPQAHWPPAGFDSLLGLSLCNIFKALNLIFSLKFLYYSCQKQLSNLNFGFHKLSSTLTFTIDQTLTWKPSFHSISNFISVWSRYFGNTWILLILKVISFLISCFVSCKTEIITDRRILRSDS